MNSSGNEGASMALSNHASKSLAAASMFAIMLGCKGPKRLVSKRCNDKASPVYRPFSMPFSIPICSKLDTNTIFSPARVANYSATAVFFKCSGNAIIQSKTNSRSMMGCLAQPWSNNRLTNLNLVSKRVCGSLRVALVCRCAKVTNANGLVLSIRVCSCLPAR